VLMMTFMVMLLRGSGLSGNPPDEDADEKDDDDLRHCGMVVS